VGPITSQEQPISATGQREHAVGVRADIMESGSQGRVRGRYLAGKLSLSDNADADS